MEWTILAGPLVGSMIGFVTNKIAVEMLFKPHKPIYIGKYHVPFTPGIIPKGKKRLGKAIGDAVGKNLLTPQTIKETLLSEQMETYIKNHLDSLFLNLSSDEETLELKLQQNLGVEVFTTAQSNLEQLLTEKVNHGLLSMNFGDIVAREVLNAVQDKIKGTMIAMLMNESTLAPIVEEIKVRVNQYIEENCDDKVSHFIHEEVSVILDKPIASLLENLDILKLKKMILNYYHILINNYAETILNTLNLSEIVEQKVNGMEVQEVEDLVLSIMKKELGAVVNLGAVIGFILGLLNIILR